MKILLLEDDEATRTHLERVLGAAGHVVDTCTSGQDAIFLASTGDHGVLILDRMVPGLDGLGALKALRAMGVRTPALFLTAMNGVEDRVEGLEGGADDYLAKPFAASELLARVNALARRPPIVETQTVLTIEDLQLDRIRRTVTRGGMRIDMQAQELKLLEYLMLHAGEVVTRTMLLENVWSFHFDPRTNVIESHMSRLRGKVDRGFGKELIQTVRGAGYRIDGG
ncbi:two-component system OmpR family response regulator [Novosphingobium sp. PhB55]|uniref:winged helix-turn-helix domain-containing protein n=1 Tax=Novosphingobium sp. PhB55 TaxID=2485106 RepID=UPI001066F47A|nr:response regulator transcription factor [Novosphingobium sp. PhB55]TDW67540.1 two-component system OmpR family response regulator [Novosphingobium sp. PhB55]